VEIALTCLGLRQSLGVFTTDTLQKMMGKWLVLVRQRLGLKRGREMRINPPWTAFVRVFFRGAKKISIGDWRFVNEMKKRVTNLRRLNSRFAGLPGFGFCL